MKKTLPLLAVGCITLGGCYERPPSEINEYEGVLPEYGQVWLRTEERETADPRVGVFFTADSVGPAIYELGRRVTYLHSIADGNGDGVFNSGTIPKKIKNSTFIVHNHVLRGDSAFAWLEGIVEDLLAARGNELKPVENTR